MKRIVCLAVLMALVAAVLPAAGGRNPMEKKLATFLDQVIGRIEPLSRSAAIASYDASISGREADYQKSAALQLELKKIQSDRTQFARLKEFRQSGKIVDVFAGKEYLFTATVNETGEISLAKNSSIAQEMIRRYQNNENIKLRPV